MKIIIYYIVLWKLKIFINHTVNKNILTLMKKKFPLTYKKEMKLHKDKIKKIKNELRKKYYRVIEVILINKYL